LQGASSLTQGLSAFFSIVQKIASIGFVAFFTGMIAPITGAAAALGTAATSGGLLGAALSAFPPAALMIGLAAGIGAVVKGIHDLWTLWKEGKPMWDYFSGGGGFWDNSIIGRWLGLSKGVKEAAEETKKQLEAIDGLMKKFPGMGAIPPITSQKAGGFAEGSTDPFGEVARSQFLKDNLAKNEEATNASITETESLWDEWYALEAKMDGDSLASKEATIDRWLNKEEAALEKSKKFNANYWNQLTALQEVADLKQLEALETFTMASIKESEKLGEESIAAIAKSMGGMPFVLKDLAVQMGNVRIAAKGIQADSFQMTNGLGAGFQRVDGIIGLMPDLSDQAKKHIKEVSTTTHEWGDSLDQLANSLTQLAQVSGNAFGGIVQDIAKAIVAFKLAKTSADDFKAAMAKDEKGNRDYGGMVVAAIGMASSFMSATAPNENVGTGKGVAQGALSGAATGRAIGAIAGPIGEAVGAVVGAIVGFARNLGVSAAEKAGRETEANFEKQFGSFDAMMAAVGKAYDGTGRSAAQAQADVKALMDAEKLGSDAVQAAINKITAVFIEEQKRVEFVNKSIQELVGLAAPLGVQLPASLKAAIDKLIEMKGVSEDNIALLKTLTGTGEVDFKKMAEIAGKYKIDLGNLGPAFQGARLHDAASVIINDFDVLTRNGADVGSVLEGMRGDIGKLVGDSIKFGVDIPSNMQPWIDKLMATGGLVDANGDKITDLSGIKFADPIVTEFQKIVNKIQELIDKIGTGLTSAIDGVPKPKDIDVNVVLHPKRDPKEWQDIPYGGGPIVSEAAGGSGRAEGPTMFYSAGNEDFAFSGEGKSFGSGGGGGGATHQAFTIQVYMNGRHLADALVPELPGAVKRYGLTQ
jgi:hypothetical protein